MKNVSKNLIKRPTTAVSSFQQENCKYILDIAELRRCDE